MAHLPNQRRFIPVALVTGVVVTLLAAGAASTAAPRGGSVSASPPPPPVAELLSRGTTANKFEAESGGIELEADRAIDVAVVHLTFEPGSSTGWHTHSGPVVVTVTAGTLAFRVGSQCTRHVYKVGDTFVENGGRVLSRARNPGETTTETITTFYLPVGAATFTPANAPACAR